VGVPDFPTQVRVFPKVCHFGSLDRSFFSSVTQGMPGFKKPRMTKEEKREWRENHDREQRAKRSKAGKASAASRERRRPEAQVDNTIVMDEDAFNQRRNRDGLPSVAELEYHAILQTRKAQEAKRR
jgi:hypothetical protein